jgi:hypothetical protein
MKYELSRVKVPSSHFDLSTSTSPRLLSLPHRLNSVVCLRPPCVQVLQGVV